MTTNGDFVPSVFYEYSCIVLIKNFFLNFNVFEMYGDEAEVDIIFFNLKKAFDKVCYVT